MALRPREQLSTSSRRAALRSTEGVAWAPLKDVKFVPSRGTFMSTHRAETWSRLVCRIPRTLTGQRIQFGAGFGRQSGHRCPRDPDTGKQGTVRWQLRFPLYSNVTANIHESTVPLIEGAGDISLPVGRIIAISHFSR